VPEGLDGVLESAGALRDTEACISMLGTTLYGVGDAEGLKEAWAKRGEVVVCGLLQGG